MHLAPGDKGSGEVEVQLCRKSSAWTPREGLSIGPGDLPVPSFCNPSTTPASCFLKMPMVITIKCQGRIVHRQGWGQKKGTFAPVDIVMKYITLCRILFCTVCRWKDFDAFFLHKIYPLKIIWTSLSCHWCVWLAKPFIFLNLNSKIIWNLISKSMQSYYLFQKQTNKQKHSDLSHSI